jgi:hypothetical protein
MLTNPIAFMLAAIIAAVGGIAAMPFYTAPVEAAGRCHLNQGSGGCNQHSFLGGFNCNRGHPFPNCIDVGNN